MKILHTADWHIGQLFFEYDRTDEHRQFLNWLLNVLKDEAIDVLLISGDVFDLSNPAAASVKLFYTFLNQALVLCPDIQIVIIAGNHDSAHRLESPKPLLAATSIHIVGFMERDEHGQMDLDKLIIPLRKGDTTVWCMAVPFLRAGDYPVVPDSSNPYTDGVAALYHEVYERVCHQKKEADAIIAMGHLHARHAEITALDNTERLIMGGVECIPATAFPEEISYVALGHIHKAQRIGGKEHIRYSGSPLPMSFSELNYKHQVIMFDLEGRTAQHFRSAEVPLAIALQRVPLTHKPLTEVLQALELLPDASEETPPYLEVRVLLDGPEPALRHKIETALKGKQIRLARIDVAYPQSADGADTGLITPDKLHELQPLDVFSRAYQSKYHTAAPEELLQLFHKVVQEVNQSEQ